MKTLVPLYVHPVADPDAWRRVVRWGSAATVVINVHNGPGEDADPGYRDVTGRLAAAGVPMLGYVDFDYGSRPGSAVRTDIERWSEYPVGGVFLDRTPTGAAGLGTLARACAAVAGTVVLNPGTRPDPGYFDLAEVVCTYEGPWSAYDASPGTAKEAHLVYGVPPQRWDEAVALVSARVPYGFVTELDAPLPYLGLPARLDADGVRG